MNDDVEKYLADWRQNIRANAVKHGIDESVVDALVASIEPCVRAQAVWMDAAIKSAIPIATEPGDLEAFRDHMLDVAHREPVYLVEAHCFENSLFRENGAPVRVDETDTFEGLKFMVFAAFDECISHVIITHNGESKRINTCAQFMAEYAPQ